MTEQRETRLMSEYLAERWPTSPVRVRVPLGPIAPSVLAAFGPRAIGAARPLRPEADAVIFAGGRVIVAEAKIMSVIDGIAKLPIYRGLIDSTPELLPYVGLPREMYLVCPWETEEVSAMAATVGVKVEVYRPPWIEPYLESRMQYWTPQYRAAREARLARRRALGVE